MEVQVTWRAEANGDCIGAEVRIRAADGIQRRTVGMHSSRPSESLRWRALLLHGGGALPDHLQVPPAHALPPEHGWSQPPQWRRLLLVFTHVPPQLVRLPPHTHLAELQVVPPGHDLPQPPQCCAELARFTQPDPQSMVPGAQLHAPPLHALPPAHTTPQPPQLRLSLA